MSHKNRRLSLDSTVGLERDTHHGGTRSSSRFVNKKAKQSQSLDDARLEIQALNHSLSSNTSLREQTIAEERHDRPEGPITNSSFLKHNKTFHKLFQEIPEGENLTHAFTCALQKEVLYHGKLYVSEGHVCFHSSVLLKETKVLMTVCSVAEVKKHNSALSMLSIQTSGGEKYSFVSLRHRQMCFELLQTICSQAECNCAPGDNEADPEVASSYSSLEDNAGPRLSRQNSLHLDNGSPQMSSEVPFPDPPRSNSSLHSSLTGEDRRAVSWIGRINERVQPLFFISGMMNLSVLFYIYMTLMVLILVASGYIGLRMVALEEQLKTLGILTEMAVHRREYQET